MIRVSLLALFLLGCAHTPSPPGGVLDQVAVQKCQALDKAMYRTGVTAWVFGLSGMATSLGLISPTIRIQPADEAALGIFGAVFAATVVTTVTTGLNQKYRHDYIVSGCTRHNE